jgi:stress response protein SCP2
MAWNYRKRIKIVPGVHLNVSKNAYIRAIDGAGNEMVKFSFTHDPVFDGMHTICFGELFSENEKWYLQTNIQMFAGDQFVDIIKRHTFGQNV